MKHCVVDLYPWASRFFVEPTYGELDIFVTVGGLVYVDQSEYLEIELETVKVLTFVWNTKKLASFHIEGHGDGVGDATETKGQHDLQELHHNILKRNISLSRTTSQAMTHKYWTLLELLCGYVAGMLLEVMFLFEIERVLLVCAGCCKMLSAILTASERFLDLKLISQQQPPQGVTRVFKCSRRLVMHFKKSHQNLAMICILNK
ncbi:hypothetical protein DPMN_071699 [Dreissena polymorpha]|uniref:Uncharacterized protein n=1 Tax=Dreissena polymorpha TaxID=45954 RepID=A0A9D4BWG6_DREPO|nr:hypothetical protein DPMN_071699 [Dreissena polymorpha]